MAQPRAALVFDQMAREYDDVFTNSMIGRAQRDAVWSVLTRVFERGDRVLELNCGTGEDALFLAQNGISVTACDASEQMIQIASGRLRKEAPGAPYSSIFFRPSVYTNSNPQLNLMVSFPISPV